MQEMPVIQVILVEPDKVQSDLYSINLSSGAGVEVIPTENAQEAISFLSILPDVEMVLAKMAPPGSESKSLVDFIAANHHKAKVILYGDKIALTAPFLKVIPEKIPPEKMVEMVKSDLGLVGLTDHGASGPEYTPVMIDFLNYFSKSPVEVYVQVGTGAEAKYIKRFNRDGPVEVDFLDKYKKKGLKNLHLKKEDYTTFAQALNKVLLLKLSEDKMGVEEGETFNPIHQIVFEKIIQVNRECDNALEGVGMDPEEVKLATQAITSVLKTFEKSTSLVGTLTKIFQTQATFGYRHSYMAGVVGHNILKQLPGATRNHFEALLFTCFFHDIVLDKDDMIVCASEKDVENLPPAVFSTKDKEKTLKHALMAHNYVKQKGQFPAEADIILKHHHGSETGVGFPTQISDKVHPVAVAFMVAEAFVLKIITSDNKNIDVLKVIKEISTRFEGNQVAITIEALKKALISSS